LDLSVSNLNRHYELHKMFMKDILLVRPGDEEIHLKPVWVALALLDPVLLTTSEHF
jgi:hypothetical protein